MKICLLKTKGHVIYFKSFSVINPFADNKRLVLKAMANNNKNKIHKTIYLSFIFQKDIDKNEEMQQ